MASDSVSCQQRQLAEGTGPAALRMSASSSPRHGVTARRRPRGQPADIIVAAGIWEQNAALAGFGCNLIKSLEYELEK